VRKRVVAIAAVGLLVGVIPPADAAGFHGYSVAYETSAAGSYTGIRTTRDDINIKTTSIVYQPTWVLITSDAQNWEELGTANTTPLYTRYWYWGYGLGGSWYELGRRTGIGTGTHTFSVYRTGGLTWHYVVDSTQMGTDSWSRAGAWLTAGLESYDSGASVPKFTDRSLSRTTNEGSWVLWAGFDQWLISAGMCGGWDYAYQWRAAENNPC